MFEPPVITCSALVSSMVNQLANMGLETPAPAPEKLSPPSTVTFKPPFCVVK